MAQFVAAAKVNGSMYGIGDYRSHATIARMFVLTIRLLILVQAIVLFLVQEVLRDITTVGLVEQRL